MRYCWPELREGFIELTFTSSESSPSSVLEINRCVHGSLSSYSQDPDPEGWGPGRQAIIDSSFALLCPSCEEWRVGVGRAGTFLRRRNTQLRTATLHVCVVQNSELRTRQLDPSTLDPRPLRARVVEPDFESWSTSRPSNCIEPSTYCPWIVVPKNYLATTPLACSEKSRIARAGLNKNDISKNRKIDFFVSRSEILKKGV